MRTGLDVSAISADEAVAACKSLSRVERALLYLMTVGLEARPPYVYSAERVRAHVFLCTLARHLERHLQPRLTILAVRRPRPRSRLPQRASPVHGLANLLEDLATLAPHTGHLPGNPEHCFLRRHPTDPVAAPAFELLDVDPAMMFPVRDQIE